MKSFYLLLAKSGTKSGGQHFITLDRSSVRMEMKAGMLMVGECPSMKRGHMPLHFNVISESQKVFHENTDDKTALTYSIHIHPCVVMKNMLPIDIDYILMEGMSNPVQIKSGQKSWLVNAKIGNSGINVRLLKYDN